MLGLVEDKYVMISVELEYYKELHIENFNRELRKVTKAKAVFPTDDALFKSIYLAMVDITKKWTDTSWNWGIGDTLLTNSCLA